MSIPSSRTGKSPLLNRANRQPAMSESIGTISNINLNPEGFSPDFRYYMQTQPPCPFTLTCFEKYHKSCDSLYTPGERICFDCIVNKFDSHSVPQGGPRAILHRISIVDMLEDPNVPPLLPLGYRPPASAPSPPQGYGAPTWGYNPLVISSQPSPQDFGGRSFEFPGGGPPPRQFTYPGQPDGGPPRVYYDQPRINPAPQPPAPRGPGVEW